MTCCVPPVHVKLFSEGKTHQLPCFSQLLVEGFEFWPSIHHGEHQLSSNNSSAALWKRGSSTSSEARGQDPEQGSAACVWLAAAEPSHAAVCFWRLTVNPLWRKTRSPSANSSLQSECEIKCQIRQTGGICNSWLPSANKNTSLSPAPNCQTMFTLRSQWQRTSEGWRKTAKPLLHPEGSSSKFTPRLERICSHRTVDATEPSALALKSWREALWLLSVKHYSTWMQQCWKTSSELRNENMTGTNHLSQQG